MNEQRYSVRWLMDSEYEVRDTQTNQLVFSGNLSDCEAWIRLTERGLLK